MISCFIIPWGDASDVCIHQSISSIILKNPVKGEGFHELIQEWDPLKFKSIQQKLWLERNQIQKHTLTAFESWKDVPEAPSGQPASRKSILSLQKYHIYYIYIYKALTLSCKKTHTHEFEVSLSSASLSAFQQFHENPPKNSNSRMSFYGIPRHDCTTLQLQGGLEGISILKQKLAIKMSPILRLHTGFWMRTDTFESG